MRMRRSSLTAMGLLVSPALFPLFTSTQRERKKGKFVEPPKRAREEVVAIFHVSGHKRHHLPLLSVESLFYPPSSLTRAKFAKKTGISRRTNQSEEEGRFFGRHRIRAAKKTLFMRYCLYIAVLGCRRKRVFPPALLLAF